MSKGSLSVRCFGLAFLLAAIALTATAQKPATPFDLQLEGPAGETFKITVGSVERPQENKTLSGSLPFRGSLDVGPGPWTLLLEGAKLFPCRLETAEPSISLRLGAPATVAGRLALPRAGQPPQRAQLRISSRSTPGTAAICASPQILTECQLEGLEFECSAPAGRQDIRLEIPGNAPTYWWDADLSGEKKNHLGAVQLRPGGSVAGWLKVTGASETRPKLVASPYRLGPAESSAATERFSQLDISATVAPNLFFQVSGLLPGTWILRAEAAGLAPSRIGPIDVVEGKETWLPDAIELVPPVALDVYLEPATDFEGRPWRILLLRSSSFSQVAETVKDIRADDQGKARLSALQPGEYRLEIMDRADASWLEMLVDVRPEIPPLFLEIPAVKVAGELRIGTKAVPGRIIFGAYSRPRIPMETDDEGRFEGVLPRSGEWKLIVDRGQFELRVPPVLIDRKGERNLTIRLPDTALRGTVWLAEEPAAKATVVLRSGISPFSPLGSVVADENGKFEFLGIEPGPVRAVAALGKQTGEWVQLELREGGAVEQDLHIQPTRKVVGRLVTSAGPIPGAAVVAFFGSGPFPAQQQKSSGPDGSFDLEVPVKEDSFDLLVVAPGLATTWLQVRLSGASFEVAMQAETGQLNLVAPGELEGWTLKHAASTLPLRVLYRWMSEAGALSQRQADFAIVFRGLETGPYQLCRSSQGGPICADGHLSAGGDLDLDPCGSSGHCPSP